MEQQLSQVIGVSFGVTIGRKWLAAVIAGTGGKRTLQGDWWWTRSQIREAWRAGRKWAKG